MWMIRPYPHLCDGAVDEGMTKLNLKLQSSYPSALVSREARLAKKEKKRGVRMFPLSKLLSLVIDDQLLM